MKTARWTTAGLLVLGIPLLIGSPTSSHSETATEGVLRATSLPLHPPLVLDLDVRLSSPGAPFFEAYFPHASHTRWLGCSSCHPGSPSKRADMAGILAGESCGACHGKTAFATETDCWRCHPNLVRPRGVVVEADIAEARVAPLPETPEILERGLSLFRDLCADCHGEKGEGEGPFASFMNPKPRDFRGRTFLSTDGVDLGLYRMITVGIKGTGMPAWSALSSTDRWALVHHVKTLYE